MLVWLPPCHSLHCLCLCRTFKEWLFMRGISRGRKILPYAHATYSWHIYTFLVVIGFSLHCNSNCCMSLGNRTEQQWMVRTLDGTLNLYTVARYPSSTKWDWSLAFFLESKIYFSLNFCIYLCLRELLSFPPLLLNHCPKLPGRCWWGTSTVF